MIVSLTCDRFENLWRVAVWRGDELCDLYFDHLIRADLTGAIVGARVNRLAAGNKAAWCEAGQGLTIYVENPGHVRSGEILALKITGYARQGKAWGGVIVENPIVEEGLGVIVNPPRPWERALADLKDVSPASIIFSHRDDCAACQEYLEKRKPEWASALKPLSHAPHPELDDLMEGLKKPEIGLSGGASIIIEETEAMIVADVNAGESGNALSVNLQAVREIARQIRLRNMSGIIVIDALKTAFRPDNAKVLNALKKAVAEDPAGVNVFGLTKLGLIELTRQRRGPSLHEVMSALKDG